MTGFFKPIDLSSSDYLISLHNSHHIPSNYKKELAESTNNDVNYDEISNDLPTVGRILYGTAVFDYYFKPDKKSKMLFVTLRGWRANGGDDVHFERISYQYIVNCNFLAINNPQFHNYPDLNAGWFIGPPEEDYTLYLSRIIKKIANTISVPQKNIIIMGSSAAGTAAIHCSEYISGSYSVSINPQLLPHANEYLLNDFKKTGYSLSDYPPSRTNTQYILEQKKAKHIIIVNVRSDEDFIPLRKLLLSKKLAIQYGLKIYPDCNLIIWLYDAYGVGPGRAHDCFEDPIIMESIMSLINALQKDEQINEDVYLWLNEHWFSRFETMTNNEIARISSIIQQDNIEEIVHSTAYENDNPLMWTFKCNLIRKNYKPTMLEKYITLSIKLSKYDPFFLIDAFDKCYSTNNALSAELLDVITKYSELGEDWAKGRLARCYRDGRNVKKNLKKASKLFKQSSSVNTNWLNEYLNCLCLLGDANSIAMVRTIATELVKNGNPLGTQYLNYLDGQSK